MGHGLLGSAGDNRVCGAAERNAGAANGAG